MPPAAAIFISYRREDAAGHARALVQALNPVFGPEQVFIDADDMQPGEDFEARLGAAVRGAQVMLVLIGPRWRGERETPGHPPGQADTGAAHPAAARIFDPTDYVRMEVATALAAGQPVVLPLLLDNTPMPSAAQLPPELQALTLRHALPLAHLRYDADLARLVQTLQTWVAPASIQTRPPAAPPGSAAPAPAPAPARRAGWQGLPGLGAGAGAVAVAVAVALTSLAAGWLLWAARSPAPQAGTPHDAAAAAQSEAQSAAPSAASTPAGMRTLAGRWVADVPYRWLPQPRREQLRFVQRGDTLEGAVSFLGVERPIEEGRYSAREGLQFVIRSTEVLGSDERTLVHRFRGVVQDEGIAFEMQTTGGHQPQTVLRFTARPAAAAADSADSAPR